MIERLALIVLAIAYLVGSFFAVSGSADQLMCRGGAIFMLGLYWHACAVDSK